MWAGQRDWTSIIREAVINKKKFIVHYTLGRFCLHRHDDHQDRLDVWRIGIGIDALLVIYSTLSCARRVLWNDEVKTKGLNLNSYTSKWGKKRDG